ncbi:MAG: Hydrogenase expression/formation protein HypC [Candidatus Moranbacteria bacterium GW2011_GWE1_35_17]|nr:MAG: Hydrogenase expression/formation protein HypC [Candidatus Moranbacteria bacterium GW2011_GWE1_35_17]KKP71793.1 MAG: Hydrogenase expression/formation protein HypC [Candidatus Moranbacteria bacterium GW2011_GWE2_35_164]KKP81480.1 MAG: Hydrogenase expression/formation protein HypC [Candidatus Moranbacteria bacterium GW2011_GWF1_35_5]KKP84516.1 MAG: Hydrogenase expression/formation protein HypC [Candidatus Moranbacteria bacterium GW2011_GWF2_35_54]
MCLAFPGKIKKINGQNATVDFDGIEKEINISLLSDTKKGEFVIVHAGFAIEKVDQNYASDVDKLLK